jgi:sigma-E factor negative regulatory protein RseB
MSGVNFSLGSGRIAGLILALIFSSAVSPAPTFAATDDGSGLLRKAVAAGNQLTYSGVFVYRSPQREETSRIAHSAEGGRQRERIEVLDGSPREVVRDGQEVKCYLPNEKLLIVESQTGRAGFPAVFPAAGPDIAENYLVRKAQTGRVAGIESQAIYLEPRDGYRFGHELWIDPVSGLLLKSSLLGEKGEVLESFAFTQLSIGGPLDRNALVPKFDAGKIKVKRMDNNDVRPEELPWVFRNSPPGFRKQKVMRRPSAPGAAGAERLHVVFSDGAAAISVFFEPVADAVEDKLAQVGSVQVYRRRIDGYQAVVMGEVPAAAVRRLGDGIERKVR